MNDRSAGTQVSYSGASSHIGNNIEHNTNIYYNGNSMPINQSKKRYTNKKLIVPFTKEASNGAQGGTYVQRDDLLGKISDSFEAQTGKKRMVFLSGMGGSGKSELARAYAEGHSEEYDEIFWLTCRDGVKPELFSLLEDADTLEKVEKKDAYGLSDKVLIIVDNCNNDDSKFLFSLEHSTGSSDILVTTRLSRIGNYGDFLISVESDDRETFAYAVFEKNFCKKPRHGNPKKIEENDVISVLKICSAVQYNTMMVSLIGIRLREYNDLSIPECATKISEGVGIIDGKIRYSKDLELRVEMIRDILAFLFLDILKHHFSSAEKEVLTVLSLTPAVWYGIEFIVLLCGGVQPEKEYEDAVMDLMDFGWIQGDEYRVSIHPLIAEVISDKRIVISDSSLGVQLLKNYLGMTDKYLGKRRLLINKILKMGGTVLPECRLAVTILINDKRYKSFFAKLFPDVKAAYFVLVNCDRTRRFLYRNLEKDETCLLIDVPSNEKTGERAELLKVINRGVTYKLDLSIKFCEKSIINIPKRLCLNDNLLKELVFSKETMDIGSNSFKGCYRLSGELCFPEKLMNIEINAFNGCSGLSGELRLPEGLKNIGHRAFFGCSGLTGKLRFPKGLTSIGARAFFGCSGFTGELRLPEGLTWLGSSAFEGCSGLDGQLLLPERLTIIRAHAFEGCRGLSGVLSLPEGLTKIGAHAFDGCSSLSGTLHLPEGLTIIGSHAFSNCGNLSGELHLPKDLSRIGKAAFENCNAFKKIIFNNPNTSIMGALNIFSSPIICGYRNSTAEEYAKTNGLVFEELEG